MTPNNDRQTLPERGGLTNSYPRIIGPGAGVGVVLGIRGLISFLKISFTTGISELEPGSSWSTTIPRTVVPASSITCPGSEGLPLFSLM